MRQRSGGICCLVARKPAQTRDRIFYKTHMSECVSVCVCECVCVAVVDV